MRLDLDKYAHLRSPIHRWEQRSKLVALLALIFGFAFVQQLVLLPAMVLVTATLFVLSRLPLVFLLTRLRYPGLLILALVSSLPFVAGETVLWQWGSFVIRQEGCQGVLLIVTRFICILTVSLVLFGTAPVFTSMKALRSLGLPDVIVDMMLLTYRYLEQLGAARAKMQQAMGLRGFRHQGWNLRTLRMLAQLVGSLLVRSYEQSHRVYQAMRLRGYGYSRKRQNQSWWEQLQRLDNHSKLACGLTLLVATAFISVGFFEY